jgi:hypothetical protein
VRECDGTVGEGRSSSKERVCMSFGLLSGGAFGCCVVRSCEAMT